VSTPLITFLSDYGYDDEFVGVCHGVIAGRCPQARVIDITHAIPACDVRTGALVLADALAYMPAGVHLAVVDPGVGARERPEVTRPIEDRPARAAVAVRCVDAPQRLLVGPDNGLLALALERFGGPLQAVEISRSKERLHPVSRTFHGRDVFAPVAAALATGTRPMDLGPAVADMQRLPIPEPRRDAEALRGQVLYVDRFGNLITNVSATLLANFPAAAASISIRGTRVAGIAPSYAAVASGQPVAVVNSWDLLEIAVRDGSAAAALGAGIGDEVVVA
jgi:S-adenosyl-L-methionine hydrolase (adenosine-forming)